MHHNTLQLVMPGFLSLYFSHKMSSPQEVTSQVTTFKQYVALIADPGTGKKNRIR